MAVRSRHCLWLGCALFLLAAAPSLATNVDESGESLQALLACPPNTDGTIEYKARYLKADWIKSEKPGEPDLAIALLARVVNRSGAPVTIPNPIVAFHKAIRVRYEDGSQLRSKADVFVPAPNAREIISLAPNESVIFGQGIVGDWADLQNHQIIEKKVLVVAEINVGKKTVNGEEIWGGCIESRIGEIQFPPIATEERYHPNETLEEFADQLRAQYRLP